MSIEGDTGSLDYGSYEDLLRPGRDSNCIGVRRQ